MKLLQNSEDARAKRKSLKPQVERRRRERMNLSLESLKTLLMQKQEATQRRVEKAEILEHTVLFLQKSAEQENTSTGGAGGQKQSLQDGFSTCLQRAAQFLGPEGKGLWLGSALDASFTARFSRLDSDYAEQRSDAHSPRGDLRIRNSSKSLLRSLLNRSGYKLCTASLRGGSCANTTEQSLLSPQTPKQSHKVSSVASKQSPQQSLPVSQSLWRPWP